MNENTESELTKNDFWVRAHDRFFKNGRRYLHARRGLPSPAKLDVSEIVNSAVDSLATFCEREGRALEDVDNLGALFFTITMRKVGDQLKKLHADVRDITREVSGDGVDVKDEDMRPDEKALLVEAWDHCRSLIEKITLKIETAYARWPELAAVAKLILASDLSERGTRAEIQEKVQRSYSMIDRLIAEIRKWAKEEWPVDYAEFEKSLRHLRLGRQQSHGGSAASASRSIPASTVESDRASASDRPTN